MADDLGMYLVMNPIKTERTANFETFLREVMQPAASVIWPPRDGGPGPPAGQRFR